MVDPAGMRVADEDRERPLLRDGWRLIGPGPDLDGLERSPERRRSRERRRHARRREPAGLAR